MIPEARIVEIERRLEGQSLSIDRLESRLAAAEQLASQLSGGMAGLSGAGGAGGAYYADPGATTIASGGSASLTVVEVKSGGDVTLGTKVVLNRFAVATTASKRLMLVKTSDGAFAVVNQDC